MFTWHNAIWALGAFLAVSTLLKMSQARYRALKSKLDVWLKEEVETIAKKKHLLQTVRKKRAEMKIEAEARAAQAAAQIAELNIAAMMEDGEKLKE